MPELKLLPPVARHLYLEHGAAIHTYDVKATRLTKMTGCTEWAARQAINHVHAHGPPDERWSVVVVGDAHFCPAYEDLPTATVRAHKLGTQVARECLRAWDAGRRVGVVVIGDWGDFPSLSFFDKGKVQSWNRTYKEDLEFNNAAASVFTQVLATRVGFDKIDRRIFVTGNHEHRITRAAEGDPAMFGTLDIGNLNWESLGWEVYPFLKPARIEDVHFVHYLENGISGSALSSINMGRQLALHALGSVVVGHNHLFKTDRLTAPLTGEKLVGTTVGCAFTQYLPWARQANAQYDRGIVVLTELKGSEYNPVFLPLT